MPVSMGRRSRLLAALAVLTGLTTSLALAASASAAIDNGAVELDFGGPATLVDSGLRLLGGGTPITGTDFGEGWMVADAASHAIVNACSEVLCGSLPAGGLT